MNRPRRDKTELGYFHNERADLARWLSGKASHRATPVRRVLEVGCAAGVLGARLKRELGAEHYAGVELAERPAAEAAEVLDRVVQGDVEGLAAEGSLGARLGGPFDLVVMADVIEHLVDPWAVLERIADDLADGGWVAGSIPNAGNVSMVFRLLTDRFEYEEAGLFDRTHLRFFTERTVRDLLAPRYRIVALERRTPPFSAMPPKQKALYLALSRVWPLGFTSSFWFVAEKRARAVRVI